MSGSTAEDIVAIPPDFIDRLGLQQSLTPSRNNGFLNMFRLMQRKSLEIVQQDSHGAEQASPMQLAIAAQLANQSVYHHCVTLHCLNFNMCAVLSAVSSTALLCMQYKRVCQQLYICKGSMPPTLPYHNNTYGASPKACNF